MSDVVPTLGRREERERGGGERGDLVERARSGRTHEGFQFRKRHLDGIEVGTVGRQKADLRAGGRDCRTDLWLLVDSEIVEHDDIARSERRYEHLLHVGAKTGGVDRAIEHGGRREPVRPQRGDDRVRLPMTAGCVIAQAHPAGAASVAT